MVSSIFRQKFRDFQHALNSLHAYVETNQQVLHVSSEARSKLDTMIDQVEEPLRSLRNRGLPTAQDGIYKRIRTEWIFSRDYFSSSLRLVYHKSNIEADPNSPVFKLAKKTCREAFKILKKHHKDRDYPLPIRTTKLSKLEIFRQSVNQMSEVIFDPKVLKEVRDSATEFSDYIRSTTPEKTIQPLQKYNRNEEDLYDDLLTYSSTSGELKRLSETFHLENESMLLLLDQALLQAPQELVQEFSNEVFSRTRLVMIAILYAAKTNNPSLDRYILEEDKNKMLDLRGKLQNVENPVTSFLEDELNEDTQALLFQIFSKVKFLTQAYVFDNPNGLLEEEKETKIFSAVIQVFLRDKYFPKQQIVEEIESELEKALKVKKKKDYKHEFSAIIELFLLREVELGLKFLMQLCHKTKDCSFLMKVIVAFYEGNSYEQIKPRLLQIEKLPYNRDFLLMLLDQALILKDFDFACFIFTKVYKSKSVYHNFLEALPFYIQKYPDLNIWLALAEILVNLNKNHIGFDILLKVLITVNQDVWDTILDQIEKITSTPYRRIVLQELFQKEDSPQELMNFIKNRYPEEFSS